VSSVQPKARPNGDLLSWPSLRCFKTVCAFWGLLELWGKTECLKSRRNPPPKGGAGGARHSWVLLLSSGPSSVLSPVCAASILTYLMTHRPVLIFVYFSISPRPFWLKPNRLPTKTFSQPLPPALVARQRGGSCRPEVGRGGLKV
jgi:hypothetical protein